MSSENLLFSSVTTVRLTNEYRLAETPTGYVLQRQKELVHYYDSARPSMTEYVWEDTATLPLKDWEASNKKSPTGNNETNFKSSP